MLDVVALLEDLHYFDADEQRYIRLSDLDWGSRVRIRDLYFTDDGEFVFKYLNPETGKMTQKQNATVREATQYFFDDVLPNVWGLR